MLHAEQFADVLANPGRAVQFAQPRSTRRGYRNSMITTNPGDASEAARMLRLILDEMPPTTPAERAIARRIEGATVALTVIGSADVRVDPHRR